MTQDPRPEPQQSPAKTILRALAGERQPVPPIWMMRQAGRYLPEYRATRAQAGDFLSLCYTPDLAAEVTLQPIRRYGFDAAILFADILLIPRALGQDVWFETGEGPRLGALPVIGRMEELAAGAGEHLHQVGETLSRVRAELEPERALIGFAGAPWTVATYMVAGAGSRDQSEARRLAYRDPSAFGILIDRIVIETVDYLSGQIEAGVDAVQLFDSWSGSLSPAQFDRWVIAPTRRIADALAMEITDHDIMIDVGHGRPVRHAEGNPVWREDRDFIDAVQGRENRIRCPYAEALETHRVALAVSKSAASGELVKMEVLRLNPQPFFRQASA